MGNSKAIATHYASLVGNGKEHSVSNVTLNPLSLETPIFKPIHPIMSIQAWRVPTSLHDYMQ